MSRRDQLARHPLCQYELPDGSTCGAIAAHVHHIIELTQGGDPRDPNNLQSVCASHHSTIHAQRRGGVAR
jgi:5-methylcytosine-specific restriction endonuclease McrA